MIDSILNGVPVQKQGAMRNQFTSGRIAVMLMPHGGIGTIFYAGSQELHHDLILTSNDHTSAFTKLLRLQVSVDGKWYYTEFNNTEYYPYGFRSECTLAGVRFRHELVLDHDTLFQRVQVLENPENRATGARILQHNWCLSNAYPNRVSSGWSMEDGVLKTQLTENDMKLNIRISCDRPHQLTCAHCKYYLNTTENETETVFWLTFGEDPTDASARVNRVIARDQALREQGVRFVTGSVALDSALNNVVPTLQGLQVPDQPGAVRASQNYWVWGWDSMVHAETYLWSGNTELVRDMLRFYRDTADPEKGVGHCFNPDYKIMMPMNTCAQCLYIVMLHHYYAATGDADTLWETLEFAEKLLERSEASLHNACALGLGKGYFPDFPEHLEQEDEDVALINNSLYLQALRAVSELYAALGMEEKAGRLTQKANLVQSDMERVLWDEKAGYWCDSARGSDLAKRPYHPVYGQLYVSSWGAAPHGEQAEKIAAYMKKHFLFDFGLYMYVPEEPGFMADGNQLGAYYPAVDRYYWNMMNRAGDAASEPDFEKIVTYFWQTHTYPEGLTHETVNEDPTVDNPGGKQAFTMKAWFCDALELGLGLTVEADGFSCHPLKSDRSFRVENIVLRGKKLTFERKPEGIVLLNGKELAPGKHPWSELEQC